MALLNTWASQQDQATLSPLSRLLNNYIQKSDAPLAYLMRGDAQGLLKDLNTPKPVNTTRDMTDLALNLNPVMGLIGATAYHGSPHIFNKFDINKVGTGEGAQAYGHGMYFAENPEIAQQYQKSLSKNVLINKETGQTFSPYDLDSRVTIQSGLNQGLSNEEIARKVEEAAKQYDKIGGLPQQLTAPKLRNEAEMVRKGIIGTTEGSLYKVDIPDKNIPKMLNWDISLQKQPEVLKTLGVGEKEITRYNAIKKQIDAMPGQYDIDIPKERAMFDKHTALEKEYNDIGLHKTGQKYYEDLIKKYGSAKNVSQELNKKGITGIKYLDAQSRGILPRIEERQLTSNYVVFDPSEVKILEKGLLSK
jgi:hypothetical protein